MFIIVVEAQNVSCVEPSITCNTLTACIGERTVRHGQEVAALPQSVSCWSAQDIVVGLKRVPGNLIFNLVIVYVMTLTLLYLYLQTGDLVGKSLSRPAFDRWGLKMTRAA